MREKLGHPSPIRSERSVAARNAPPICQILASIRTDLRCVQRSSKSDCSANALEIIEPLENETDHAYVQLACDRVSLKSDDVPYGVRYMFGEVNEVCSQSPNEVVWKPIHRVLCDHREQLMQQKECFINASTTLVQCNQKPANETVCHSLEQFSNNIDCALRVMLDACTVEAQNVAVAIQDALNDELIAHHCYNEASTNAKSGDDAEEFKLNPKYERCTSDQENLALTCLVELIEVNRKIAELNNLNFLHEISEENSTVIFEICTLYGKYDSCISDTVFAHSNGKRCAFNSPLNTLARIGLLPICSKRTRSLLQNNKECIQKIGHRTGICQSGLNSLGLAIHNMLQGIHGEAHLCNSYYLIRDAFQCGERIFAESCSPQAIQSLQQIRQMVIELGTEEGCPDERPTQPTAPPIVACEPREQRQFSSCIQTITTFQPHPLVVIKQPKQIDEACKQFVEFKKCQANITCLPLWAKGMTAMFDFACGAGYNTYTQVRQCIRKITTRKQIRECVSEFSHSSPQIACESSKKLLACSTPVINEKCGELGAQFVTDYIEQFVNVIDPKCKIRMQQSYKSVMSYNCTAEQNARIDHCAVPINDLTYKIDELFEGGLRQFLVNVKNLAPVFAKGCNLTSDFKHCLRPFMETQSKDEQCVISSCLIEAGHGICDQPDTAKAIDDNLACIFKQASIPEFGKCLRLTIATLKQFNLLALRAVLPQFIKCIEHIVVQRCGHLSISVLRAISTAEICPISLSDQLKLTKYDVSEVCHIEMRQKHLECVGNFHQNYRMLPIALLRDPSSIDMLCTDMTKLSSCSYPVCETSKEKALSALAEFMCLRHEAYKKHSTCLTSVITSSQGSKCLASFLPTATEEQCAFLTNVANCATPYIHNSCGYEALALSFEGMNVFANQLNKSCNIQIPIASIKTNCAESDVIEYLQCESLIDNFSFTPFSFIRNSAEWDEFCDVIDNYENCLTNISCRVEPISSGNIALFRTICGKEKSKTKYHLPCLAEFTSSDSGVRCSESFLGLDLLAKNSSKKICSILGNMLSCAAPDLSARCTSEALKHVASMLLIWVRHFDPNCSLSGFNKINEPKAEDDFSLDSGPTHISIDQTISPPGSSTVKQNSFIITASPSSSSNAESSTNLSDSRPEVITSSVQLPEFNLETKPQPGPTSTTDTEFATDSIADALSTRPSIPSIPGPNSGNSSDAKKSKMRESGQMRSTSPGLWIVPIAAIVSTITLLVQ
ncbi:unnamed protein product [Litomosoides sigmodontis]|uniref:T20D4.11-like domain-containing protein n=1 Tax=Litomosoides sigmodontis TaxID=42156 RepID=A0A3P6TG34_LITSI|nr:unnamed protein product [Litomosoides sigmodontis]